MSGRADLTFEPLGPDAGHGQLARILVDGGKGNVFDLPLIEETAKALCAAAAAPAAKAVLIEGAGDHFSFGASVDDHRPEKMDRFLGRFHALFRELMATPMVRVAVVRGQCLGGGLELALGCQRIVASPSAKLGQPEIRLAVFAPVASLLLPARVGQPAADDLLLTGRSVDAKEALSMRLVDEIADDPLAAARAWAAKHLAPLSASSLRYAARAAWASHAARFRSELDAMERLYLDELMKTHDAVEGITAFLEKRPPKHGGTT